MIHASDDLCPVPFPFSPDGPLAAEARRQSQMEAARGGSVTPEGGSSPSNRGSVAHARRGSVVPVNVDRSAVSHNRRKSNDVPSIPVDGLPKLAPGDGEVVSRSRP